MKDASAMSPKIDLFWIFHNPVHRRVTVIIGLFLLAMTLVACGNPQPVLEGPTPIPTLIPATLPPSELEPAEAAPLVVESYPAGLPSAEAGQALYAVHCASCHGADGNGQVPNARNFGDVDYMRGETPVEFYTIISEGRGSEMLAFGEELTSDQRWDVVYFVWRFSTTNQALARGREIYGADCASCHGEDGRSMILGAANFPDHRFLSNQSPSDLYVSVTQGRGSMPAWQARLSQEERWAVIDYVRTFNYDPNVSGEIETPEEPEPTAAEPERPECAPYLAEVNPFGWDDAGAIASGETLYVSCAGCHGEDGTGAVPGVPDLSSPAVQADIRENVGEILCSLAEGLNTMPSFKSSMSEEEMWQALTYIATFATR